MICHFAFLSLKKNCFILESTDKSLANKVEATSQETNDAPPPPLPDMCCMSGCPNCVWIEHAENLVNFYHDHEAAKAAIDNIPDESLKAFLRIELGIK